MMLTNEVCRVGGRASEEAAGLGKQDSEKVEEVRSESDDFGSLKNGFLKPVGDGFEDGVLFCDQKASAFFSGTIIYY